MLSMDIENIVGDAKTASYAGSRLVLLVVAF